MNRAIELSKVLWDYHHVNHDLEESDILLVLGNSDINTIVRGIELYKMGLAPYIVITGGHGGVTSNLWVETEAQVFSRIALESGVDASKIILEDKSSNTGENYEFSGKLLKDLSVSFESVIIVTKPYMERRAYATAKIHWPNVSLKVTSIGLSLEEYLEEIKDDKFVMSMMVGDLQRIRVYPDLGFQIPQEIPDEVQVVYEELVALGYTSHLVTDDAGNYR